MLLVNGDKEFVEWVAKADLEAVKASMQEGDMLIKSAKGAAKEGLADMWEEKKAANKVSTSGKPRATRVPTPTSGAYEVIKTTVLEPGHPSYDMFQSLASNSTIEAFLAENEGKSHRTKGDTGIMVTPKSLLAYAIKTGKIRLI